MNKRISTALLCLYVVAAVVTFGHAAAGSDREYELCKRADPQAYCGIRAPKGVMIGIVAGAAWPLYWSWEIWER
jgi:hypothetical protein